MKTNVTINGSDAYGRYGIILTENSIGTLLAPPPVKGYISNRSPGLPGAQVLPGKPVTDEREIQLTMAVTARSTSEFFSRYGAFTAELAKGDIELTLDIPGMGERTFHLKYLSCSQFTQYDGRLGKFILKFNEPNPEDKSKW